jgi:hypothetical protein
MLSIGVEFGADRPDGMVWIIDDETYDPFRDDDGYNPFAKPEWTP